ncbi:N-acetyl-D-Glu racemase DgcA [Sphingobium lignivorans]|uniref:Dipeptide epimerase n=1 Tax=Sphingobium lignivorans TaxID=2735886 RepID=A0ABR6NEG7_9SPHN|nr:N-acetyl-D-Glu racemase DgcA [Sphingobium lignivorans]MBB5985461.1 L-alanine-DL-glutamate epimerase-like enolase superfamily enzyme [Sphingobium lignivorans]
MLRTLDVRNDSFPLIAPFRISRGVKSAAEVVTVSLTLGDHVGRGEAVPYPRYGESIEGTIDAIEAVRAALEAGANREEIGRLMSPGAARNAVDCALWDLEARLADKSVPELLGRPALTPVPTALTVGLDTPDAMAAAAAKLAYVPLIKVKVDRNDPAAQIRAVRAAAPRPRIIVDPNESWTMAEVRDLQSLLAEARVDLLEQPLPSEEDGELAGFRSVVPIAADESAHVAGDVAVLREKYQVVNIKLDKTGGLTAALDLAASVQAHGMGLMVGCMVSSSLSIAPALVVAARAAFIDLDGPVWLKHDREGGVSCTDGVMSPPRPGFWGNP